MNVGLIGAGRIGQIHGRNLATQLPGARLAAVADIDRSAAEKLAAEHGLETIADDYRTLLDDSQIDAVAICSATDTHSQIIEDAAQAGKHIFCEKPIHLSVARIDQALAAVEQAGVKLQIGFNRRFDPNFRRIREMVEAGEIGEPHLLRITSRDPQPPPIEYVKVSGGIFLDMTIHDFDMARYLVGEEVEEVYATGGVMVEPQIGAVGDLDTTLVTLRFRNGVLGSIDNSRQAVYGYDQRVELFGEKGMLAAGNETPDQHLLANAEGIHRALPLYFFLERYQQSYLEEMRSFIDCLESDTEPEVTGEDGRIPVVMGMAARKSYDEQRPVRLDEIEASKS